jgi:type I restriction enzyme S subunit
LNKVVTINDVAIGFLGLNPGRLPTDPALPDTPLINIKDIEDGLLLPPGELTLVKSPGPAQDQQRLRAGDVLVSIRGTLLKTAIVCQSHEGALASANLVIFRPKPHMILPEVLQAVFLSEVVRTEILGETTGAVIKGLQIGTLKKVKLTLPPISSQEALATLLRRSDEQYRIAAQLAAERRNLALSVVARHLEVK